MPRRFLPAAQEHFVAQSNKVFTSSMPQKNWVANMIFSTRWDNKEKDDAYTFKRHDSAAEVLLRVWRVYYFIGGTAAFIVLAGFYLTAVQESSRLESASTGVYELVFYVAVLGSIVMTGALVPMSGRAKAWRGAPAIFAPQQVLHGDRDDTTALGNAQLAVPSDREAVLPR